MSFHDFRKVDGRWQRKVHGRWQWLHVHTEVEEFTRRAARTPTQNDVVGERFVKVWTWRDEP